MIDILIMCHSDSVVGRPLLVFGSIVFVLHWCHPSWQRFAAKVQLWLSIKSIVLFWDHALSDFYTVSLYDFFIAACLCSCPMLTLAFSVFLYLSI